MMTTEPRSHDTELQFGYLVNDVARLKRKAFDRYAQELKVTRSQWWVLGHVSRRDGLPQTRLAEQLDVGKMAIGGLIDRLERSGLVARVPDEEDRRVKRVFLTPKGKRLVGRLREASVYFNQRVLEGVSDSELAMTAEVLRRMKTNLVNFIGPRAGRASPDVRSSSVGPEPLSRGAAVRARLYPASRSTRR